MIKPSQTYGRSTSEDDADKTTAAKELSLNPVDVEACALRISI